MKLILRLLGLLLLGVVTVHAKDEAVQLFQNRRVTVAVPEGMEFASTKDSRGLLTVQVTGPAEKVRVHVTFLPDAEGRFATARGRKELMNEVFNEYVGSSVEKAMHFEELEPATGAGTYCIFTDASLTGKTTLPPGEFRHCTTGVKVWPGVAAMFTVFSNDPKSPEHMAVMKMLRESVEEKPVPLL